MTGEKAIGALAQRQGAADRPGPGNPLGIALVDDGPDQQPGDTEVVGRRAGGQFPHRRIVAVQRATDVRSVEGVGAAALPRLKPEHRAFGGEDHHQRQDENRPDLCEQDGDPLDVKGRAAHREILWGR